MDFTYQDLTKYPTTIPMGRYFISPPLISNNFKEKIKEWKPLHSHVTKPVFKDLPGPHFTPKRGKKHDKREIEIRKEKGLKSRREGEGWSHKGDHHECSLSTLAFLGIIPKNLAFYAAARRVGFPTCPAIGLSGDEFSNLMYRLINFGNDDKDYQFKVKCVTEEDIIKDTSERKIFQSREVNKIVNKILHKKWRNYNKDILKNLKRELGENQVILMGIHWGGGVGSHIFTIGKINGELQIFDQQMGDRRGSDGTAFPESLCHTG